MSEIAGLVASVIAITQLTGGLASTGYGYIGGVRRAPAEIRMFVEKLTDLGKVLKTLQEYAEQNPDSTVLHELNGDYGPLKGCERELKGLQRKLQPREGFRAVVDRLMWPLRECETLRSVEEIERHKTLFALALGTDNISLSASIKKHARDTHSLVQNLRAETIAHITRRHNRDSLQDIVQLEKKRKTVIDWIYLGDYNDKHEDISNRRIKGTGDWFLKTQEFNEWARGESNSRLLLGYGIPGTGKTFLSCGVINHLQSQASNGEYGVAYIYFDYKQKGRQRCTDVLANIIKQLTLQTPELPSEVEILYDDSLNIKGKRPCDKEYRHALLSLSKKFSRVFLVFDALDECQEDRRKFLLPLFRELASNGLNLFLTSRQHPQDVQSLLVDATKVEIFAKAEDIRSYILEKIEENPRAKSLVQQGECKDRIITQLVECANGMFLLAHFHINYLCQQTTANKIIKELDKLKSMPTGEGLLDPTYERVIERLQGQPKDQQELAVRILSWLVYANRILTVRELQTAVSVEQSRYELEELDLPGPETLLDVCGGLVTIDENSNTVRLAHYSVYNFLKGSGFLRGAKLQIAVTCTTYLTFDGFTEGPCMTSDIWKSRLKSYPFLHYAARQLSCHLNDCDENLSADVVLRFLDGTGNLSSYLQASCAPEDHRLLYKKYPRGQTRLHVASAIGHCVVVRRLIGIGDDINCKDHDGSSPLHCAALGGRDKVVQLLLQMGAKSTLDKNGRTPLHRAAHEGHEVIANLLLKNGTDLSIPDSNGRTALHQCALEGHEKVVRLLLENGASLLALDNNGATPLHFAASKGNDRIVKLLLSEGADISAVDSDQRTPLHCAAFKGYEKVLRLLLSEGADTSAIAGDGWTPLEYARYEGHDRVVDLLLESKDPISDQDSDKQAEIPKISTEQDFMTVDRLSASNPQNISLTVDNDGRTPLHHAAFTSHRSSGVAKKLLEEGADISAVDSYGCTPLHCAAEEGHERMVKLLVAKGASVSDIDNIGRTPLHYATAKGHVRVAKLLLRRSADLSLVDNRGWTPLHYAASEGREEMVSALLEKDACAIAIDKSGLAPIDHAIQGGYDSIADILRKHHTIALSPTPYSINNRRESMLSENSAVATNSDPGSSKNDQEDKLRQRSPTRIYYKPYSSSDEGAALTLAISEGDFERVRELIHGGIDLSTPDDGGWMPLHSAALYGHEGVVRLLLHNGADFSFVDDSGWTAAQWAISKGHKEVARLLEKVANPHLSGAAFRNEDDWFSYSYF